MPSLSSQELKNYPLVALVGRVNVGKSTLFNLLIGEKKALTAPVAGTTRDLNYGICEWRGVQFAVADSGGYMPHPANEIDEKVAKQVGAVLKKANLIILVVDGKAGLHPEDREFLKVIRAKHSKTPILLVANKADSLRDIQAGYSQEWQKLGLGESIPVSAANGLGSGDFLDIVLEKMNLTMKDQPELQVESEKKPIRVAIIGRTNVGKSSLLNRILGEERVIVSSVPNTTREPQDMFIHYGDQPIILVDTVGIRRQSRVGVKLEKEGVGRSVKNIKNSDFVLLVIEGQVTPSKQELRLARMAVDAGAGLMIVVNKWDLIEGKDTKSIQAFEALYHHYFKFVKWAPIMFISALNGQRTSKVLERLMIVAENRGRIVPQDELTVFIKKAIAKQPAARIMFRRKPVIHGFSQVDTNPPTFRLTVNDPFAINYMYLRYLENRFREQYTSDGTIIRIFTETKDKKGSTSLGEKAGPSNMDAYDEEGGLDDLDV